MHNLSTPCLKNMWLVSSLFTMRRWERMAELRKAAVAPAPSQGTSSQRDWLTREKRSAIFMLVPHSATLLNGALIKMRSEGKTVWLHKPIPFVITFKECRIRSVRGLQYRRE